MKLQTRSARMNCSPLPPPSLSLYLDLALALSISLSLFLSEKHTHAAAERTRTVADRGMHASLSRLSLCLLVQITNHKDAEEEKHNGEPFILFISQPTPRMDSSLR